MTTGQLAPPWQVSRWFNSAPLTLADLRGRVVVAHAFQMLCPGCAVHALPQMQRVRQTFPADRVAVIGLHTVFEHHEAQGPAALEAFLYEYRYAFPVGVRVHAMQGTPTLMLIDAQGRLREQHFGVLDDLALGAALGRLLGEADDAEAGTIGANP